MLVNRRPRRFRVPFRLVLRDSRRRQTPARLLVNGSARSNVLVGLLSVVPKPLRHPLLAQEILLPKSCSVIRGLLTSGQR